MTGRRGFLKMLVGGVAVAAAAPSFPFRVFSFPSEIKISQPAVPEIISAAAGYSDVLSRSMIIYYDKTFIDNLKAASSFTKMLEQRELPKFSSGKRMHFFRYGVLDGTQTIS